LFEDVRYNDLDSNFTSILAEEEDELGFEKISLHFGKR
jgi:hypothetical protein